MSWLKFIRAYFWFGTLRHMYNKYANENVNFLYLFSVKYYLYMYVLISLILYFFELLRNDRYYLIMLYLCIIL